MSENNDTPMQTCYRCGKIFPCIDAVLVACTDPNEPHPVDQPFCPKCFEWFESDESEETS